MAGKFFFFLFMSAALFAKEVGKIDDFQLWLYNGLEKKISEKTSLIAEGELRYGGMAQELFYTYLQGRISHVLNPHVEVSLGYRQAYSRILPVEDWRPVFIPLADYTVKWQWNGWKFADRNRFQYQAFAQLDNYLLYRNRIMVEAPWEFSSSRFTPTIFEEFFLAENVGFFENRFGVGGSVPTSECGKGYLFYMLRHQIISSQWRRQHVLYLWYHFRF